MEGEPIKLGRHLHASFFSQIVTLPMPAILQKQVPLAAASLLFTLFSCMTLIPSQGILYPVFICMTVARSFLYSLAAAFFIEAFPTEYYGLMNGIMIVTGGIFSCLQYALFSWSATYTEAPLQADICLLILVLVSLIHHACVWIQCRKDKKRFSSKDEPCLYNTKL